MLSGLQHAIGDLDRPATVLPGAEAPGQLAFERDVDGLTREIGVRHGRRFEDGECLLAPPSDE